MMNELNGLGSWLRGALLAMFAVLMLAGCGGGGDTGLESNGMVSVSITDAPACGFDEVNVTVRQVRIHQSSVAGDNAGGWSDIDLNPPRKINLLDLNNGVLEGLGETTLSAGHYNQVRLVLLPNGGGTPANSVVLSGTVVEIPIATPSAVQSGIKLVHPFTVRAGERTDLLLDFDACKSIVTRGNGSYALKPVIKVIPAVLNGIRGAIDPALLGSSAVVSAQRNGEVIHSTVPNPQTGEFFLARFETGSYDLVVTADGRATAVIRSVPVAAASSIAIVGTLAQPIALPASPTHIVSGVVTLNPPSGSEVATYVSARQTVAAGTVVEVKIRSADILSGAYGLTLPVAAPMLGSYGNGALPIALTAVPGAAGQYDVAVSAEGYASQSVAVDLSASDATQNFTLLP